MVRRIRVDRKTKEVTVLENTPEPELEDKVLHGFAAVLVNFMLEKEAENDAKGTDRNPDLWNIAGSGYAEWREKWEEK